MLTGAAGRNNGCHGLGDLTPAGPSLGSSREPDAGVRLRIGSAQNAASPPSHGNLATIKSLSCDGDSSSNSAHGGWLLGRISRLPDHWTAIIAFANSSCT